MTTQPTPVSARSKRDPKSIPLGQRFAPPPVPAPAGKKSGKQEDEALVSRYPDFDKRKSDEWFRAQAARKEGTAKMVATGTPAIRLVKPSKRAQQMDEESRIASAEGEKRSRAGRVAMAAAAILGPGHPAVAKEIARTATEPKTPKQPKAPKEPKTPKFTRGEHYAVNGVMGKTCQCDQCNGQVWFALDDYQPAKNWDGLRRFSRECNRRIDAIKNGREYVPGGGRPAATPAAPKGKSKAAEAAPPAAEPKTKKGGKVPGPPAPPNPVREGKRPKPVAKEVAAATYESTLPAMTAAAKRSKAAKTETVPVTVAAPKKNGNGGGKGKVDQLRAMREAQAPPPAAPAPKRGKK